MTTLPAVAQRQTATRRPAEFYHRDDEGIFQPVEPDGAGRYASTVLRGLWLDVAWLRQEPLPSYRVALLNIFRDNEALPPGLLAL